MITKYKLFENKDIIQSFLNESSIYLNEVKALFPHREDFIFLYRGYKGVVNDFVVSQQINRKPRNTDIHFHDMSGEIFNDIFGWNPRSNGAFTTTDPWDAKFYGEVYLFFPIGDYHFLWSETYSDFLSLSIDVELETETEVMKNSGWNDIQNKENFDWNNIQNKEKFDQIFKNKMRSHIKEYDDVDLYDALMSGYEISFNCSDYFMFPLSMEKQLKEIIYENNI